MPTKCFGTVRPKLFDWKSWYSLLPSPPFLSIIFFSIPDFFWYTDQRGSPTKFFSTETKKISTKLWDKSLKHKIFRYPKLVTHWRFPLRNFSALWDRHFWRKIVILPPPLPPLIHKFFSVPEIFWNKEGFPYEVFSVLWDNNIFYRKSWYSPLRHKVFRYPKFCETQTVSSTKFFELWDENFSTENRDTLLHKVHKSVVELMFVRTFWKLISKQ